VTIDGKVYTWRTNIDVKATAILTFGANPLEGEIVTIGSKVYTFQADISAQTDGLVDIGTDADESLNNLIAAITLGAGSGTAYGSSMTLHPDVTAAAGAGDTMDAEAKVPGIGGNSIVSTTDVTSGSWDTVTLEDGEGGADGDVLIGTVSASIDNLIAAILLGAGGGTTYAVAMTVHASIVAAAGAGDTMDAEAKVAGEAGNSIATVEGMTDGDWAFATLVGGSDIGAIAATATLTLTGQPLNAETVTIGSKVYTYLDDISAQTDGLVHIGATASDSLDNLIAAIDLGAGSGIDYGSSMTAHPDVDAAAGAGDTMVATAEVPGDEGNAIDSLQALTNGTWNTDTLEGGADTGPITQQMTAVRTLFGEDVSSRGGGPDWSSEDENVHTVGQRSGLVTGVGVGAADVVATSPGVTPVATEVTVE
jgi:hypothetical protein